MPEDSRDRWVDRCAEGDERQSLHGHSYRHIGCTGNRRARLHRLMDVLRRLLVMLLSVAALSACSEEGASPDPEPSTAENEPTRVVTVNPGDTRGCVQMINVESGETYYFEFDPINGSSRAHDTQACSDVLIPGDTFDIPVPDNLPDGAYRFCLQDCQTIRVG